MTQKQKINFYESVLHRIQLFREVTMDEERLAELLSAISRWSYSHRTGTGNGMLSERGQKKLITQEIKKLEGILYGQ